MRIRALRQSTTLAFLSLCVPALASTALTVTGDAGGVYNSGGSYTLGWGFTVASPIQVNALGFWDHFGNGFAPGYSTSTVDVAIWDLSQNQLASVTVLYADLPTDPLPDGTNIRH